MMKLFGWELNGDWKGEGFVGVCWQLSCVDWFLFYVGFVDWEL